MAVVAIDKSRAPFTYTGNWDIYEYEPGKYYARLLSSGTLSPKRPFICDAFLVGGGGNGGNGGNGGGGGGGGGGYTKDVRALSIGEPIPVTIGNAGKATYFGSISASGGSNGGDGGNSSDPYGGSGGSGGSSGGQGGGKWGADIITHGGNGTTGKRPFGGDVAPFKSMYFGGGGGGGISVYVDGNIPGSGGAGGGGNGASFTDAATPGATNTGGGGGGGAAHTKPYGKSGGSGIVIIRGVLNLAPTTPDGITYGQPNAGKSLLLSTGGSTDPDGDSLSYVWEHRTDSGVYTQIGITTDPQITAIVPNSGTTYQARVKAVDDKGAESGYTTGPALIINYNNPPSISGEDEDKGSLTVPPTYTYIVNDEDEGQTLMVTETVVTGSDSIPIRTFEAQRDTEYTADITAAWLRLTDDTTHTLRIQAEDNAGGVAIRNITFTRLVERIAAARAVSTDTKVSKCLISIYPDRPPDSTLHCEVSNNPFDDTPVWEDITDKLGRYVHVFENQESQQFGFAVRFWIAPGTQDVSIAQIAVRIA